MSIFSSFIDPSASTADASTVTNSTFSIKEGLQAVGSSIFSAFHTYVISPVENYLIGDLRTFTSFSEQEESSDFACHSFGILGKPVVRWVPKSKRELADVLEELDAQQGSRKVYDPANLLVATSSPVVLSDTGPSATAHRKELVGSLSPKKFVSLTLDLYKQEKKPNESSVNERIAMQAIANRRIATQAVGRGLLGIDLSTEECSLLGRLSRAFTTYSAFPISANLLKFNPEFRRKQHEFQQGVEELLQRQIKKIKDSDCETLEQRDGLLVQKIIEKMQENPNCKDLHKDPELKSLVLVLLAVDTLGQAFSQLAFELLNPSSEGLAADELLAELNSLNIFQGENEINSSILMNRAEMPILDGLYKRCVDSNNKIIIVRQAQNEIHCGEHRVPSGTRLFITAPNGEALPFSAGHRSCPGRLVAEAIFKTLVVARIAEIKEAVETKRMNRLAAQFDAFDKN